MKLAVALVVLFMSNPVVADGHHHGVKPIKQRDYRILKIITLEPDKKAYLIAREEGHLIGQPIQVELRESCGLIHKPVTQMPVLDSFSVCDIAPESFKLNSKKSAVAMKIKVADLDAYHNQVEKGIKSPEVKCAQDTRVRKFSLKKICKR